MQKEGMWEEQLASLAIKANPIVAPHYWLDTTTTCVFPCLHFAVMHTIIAPQQVFKTITVPPKIRVSLKHTVSYICFKKIKISS